MSEECSVCTDGGLCRREGVRDGRCVFHLQSKTAREADQFEEMFFRELERLKEHNSPYIDLSSFMFPRQIALSGHVFRRIILFDKAVFEGEVTFFGCTFLGEASFRRTRFKDKARFESVFKRRADFGGATFEKGVDFSKAVFCGPKCLR